MLVVIRINARFLYIDWSQISRFGERKMECPKVRLKPKEQRTTQGVGVRFYLQVIQLVHGGSKPPEERHVICYSITKYFFLWSRYPLEQKAVRKQADGK